jgi:hypothetical protein
VKLKILCLLHIMSCGHVRNGVKKSQRPVGGSSEIGIRTT